MPIHIHAKGSCVPSSTVLNGRRDSERLTGHRRRARNRHVPNYEVGQSPDRQLEAARLPGCEWHGFRLRDCEVVALSRDEIPENDRLCRWHL